MCLILLMIAVTTLGSCRLNLYLKFGALERGIILELRIDEIWLTNDKCMDKQKLLPTKRNQSHINMEKKNTNYCMNTTRE